GPLPADASHARAEDASRRRRPRRQHQDVPPLARTLRGLRAVRAERLSLGHAAAEGRLRVLGQARLTAARREDHASARTTNAPAKASVITAWNGERVAVPM